LRAALIDAVLRAAIAAMLPRYFLFFGHAAMRCYDIIMFVDCRRAQERHTP